MRAIAALLACTLVTAPRFPPVSARAAMQAYVDRGELPGVVTLLARCGETVSVDAVGFRDREARAPIRADTLFFIASMTKPITTVAVMMLYEGGRLRLDDPVSKFIPSFAHMSVLRADGSLEPARRPITIADLLSHRSGLTYGFLDNPVAARYRADGINDGLTDTGETVARNVERLAREPLLDQPGTGWHYGLSVDVLGRIVEVVSGESLDRFLRRRIFEPLGMHDTYFYVPDEKIARVAVVYAIGERRSLRPIRPGDRIGQTVVQSVTRRGSPQYFSGGAGLISTAPDYARFAGMLLGKGALGRVRLLQRPTIAMMSESRTSDLRPPPFENAQFGFGLQIAMGGASTGRSRGPGSLSWNGIFGTSFWVDPGAGLVGVFLTQLVSPGASAANAEFEQLAYESVETALPRARPGC